MSTVFYNLSVHAQSVSRISAIQWSPDGTRIATGNESGVIRVHDVSTGSILQSYTLPSGGEIYGLAWSPDSTRIAAGDAMGTLIIWTLSTNHIATLTSSPNLAVNAVSWRPTGTHIAVTRTMVMVPGTIVTIYDPITYQPVRTIILSDDGSAEDVAWSPSGDRLVVGGYGLSAIVNFDTGQQVVLEGGYYHAMTWKPNGTQIAADGVGINILDASTGRVVRSLQREAGQSFTDVSWSPDGTRIAAGLSQGRAMVWDAATGELLATYTDVGPGYVQVAWGPGGHQLAYSLADSTIVIRNTSIPRTGTGLRGEYFDNADLTGRKFFRLNPTINFAWGTGSPDPAIAADTFSVRWTGQVEPLYSETYTFITTHDDGARLWVNGQPLISDWANHAAPVERSGAIALAAGVKYDLVLEYYEHTGSASARLEWSSPRQPRQVIPAAQLYPPEGEGAGCWWTT